MGARCSLTAKEKGLEITYVASCADLDFRGFHVRGAVSGREDGVGVQQRASAKVSVVDWRRQAHDEGELAGFGLISANNKDVVGITDSRVCCGH